jgi:Leucine-rich repeat (LRR) protein
MNCRFKLGAVIVLLLTGAGSAVGAISNAEREALIALYKSTNGDNWTHKDNWLGPPGTEGSWFGVTCIYDRVAALKLDNNNLVGQIPPELGNLKGLDELFLHNNQLSGPIPPELGNLKGLDKLFLHNNQLSGPIPPELGKGNPRVYIVLGLNNNELSGSIPPELGKTIIMRLELENNKLSGPIPPELANIGMMHLLDLRNNELSGSIPPELGKLADLGGLALSSNKLSGPIPPELGNLKKLTKENCDFRYNALYTNDTSLRDFLNSKQVSGDWEGTQTVAPTNVAADALTGDSIKVSWTPIRFKEFSGGYRVFYSTSSGGPYSLFGTTEDRKASFLTVTGLKSGTTYYFVVQTVTSPHDLNKNTVISAYSKETIGGQRPESPDADSGEDGH